METAIGILGTPQLQEGARQKTVNLLQGTKNSRESSIDELDDDNSHKGSEGDDPEIDDYLNVSFKSETGSNVV